MAGGSTAPEESVRARLEAEFGPKRAAEILGDTTPPARRKQVPDHVGRKPERGTTWANKDAGSPRTLSWSEQRDAGRDQPLSVRLLVAKTGSVRCYECGTTVPQGGEFLRFSYNASQRSYCPPCGTPLARGTDVGAISPRVLVAWTAAFVTTAAVVLAALAVATAPISQSQRYLWWTLLAVLVAFGLIVFGAVTWGNTPDE